MKSLTLSLLALALLAGCDNNGSEPQAPEPTATGTVAVPPPVQIATPDLETIPPALQGRWGLVAADCEPGRADAKGLLTIDQTTLKFYESVGTLDSIEEIDPSRIRAKFGFTGEGMEWNREMILDVQDNGATLIRREYGEDAAPGPFRYTKCT